MGTPEIVVKRACPCSSRFTPVGAPIGRSGDFSSVGARVFSAQSFSAAEGWRFLKTSTMGLSATCGLDGFLSGMSTPEFSCDDREGRASGQGGISIPDDRSVNTPWVQRACSHGRLSELGLYFRQPNGNFLHQLRRPQRQFLLAAGVYLRCGPVVARQQFPGIEHAFDQPLPSVTLLDDDRHLIAHRVPRALLAEERVRLLVDLVLAHQPLVDDIEEKLLQRAHILVEVGYIVLPASVLGGRTRRLWVNVW